MISIQYIPSHYIEGLSAAEMLNGTPLVFATSLDSRGPAVFSIGKQGHALIATGEQLKMVGGWV